MVKLNLSKNRMEELHLENSLYKQARKFQQIFYELCSDYHTFCFDNVIEGNEYLKNFIVYTLFGVHLSTFNHEQIHILQMLYNKIIENSNDKNTIYCGLIFNVVYFKPKRENAYNYIYPIPIFKVGNFKRDKHMIKYDTVPLDVTYIDIGGRVYKNWQEYLAKNTLKNMTMIVPYEGIYSLDPAFPSGRFTSTVHIEKILSQTTNDPNCIMNPNWDVDMTLLSGGVSILLGGCWQNVNIKDHMVEKLSMYIAIDNIAIHGLLYTFDPATINEKFINYGKLNGTDVLKLSKHIMYIGNCIVPEKVLRNLLMYPDDDTILFEYEAHLREIRHTTEHQRKHKDALNNVKESVQKRNLVIRELKRIKTREDMLLDSTIDNKDDLNNVEESVQKRNLFKQELTTIKTREEMFSDSTIDNVREMIKRQDPVKIMKLIQDEDEINDVTEVEPAAGELVDNSVEPYVEKVLEYLQIVCKYVEAIPSSLMKSLVQSITGIKCLGIEYDLFIQLMTLVSNIANKAHPNKLKSLIVPTLIATFDLFCHCLKIFLPITTKLLPTSPLGMLLLIVIDVAQSFIMNNIDYIADYLANKIAKYTQHKSIQVA